MSSRESLYDALAGALHYPGADLPARLDRGRAAVARGFPEASKLFDAFARALSRATPEAAEETYTRAFDLNPLCALEVGWHLYGEDYARGAFLVSMRGLLRRHGVEESGELPDHLTLLLPLLGRLAGEEADTFAERHLLPALRKMIEGVVGHDSPYEDLLKAIYLVVQGTHRAAAPASLTAGPQPPAPKPC
ncbi:MAG: molecular chaperone TorD family protein [Planctomycetes bacterium]|nr:molecular chaperone TorD family protein [Planctomycetota bacterium]